MSDPKPSPPAGGWDAGTFLAAVALPILSAGLLVYEIILRHPGLNIPLDMVISNPARVVVGPAMPVLGGLTSFYLFLTGGTRRGDRRFYLVFFFVNLAVLAGWGVLYTTL